jgi:FKBP-type peptidyl-prolyl cis-trans isomerase
LVVDPFLIAAGARDAITGDLLISDSVMQSIFTDFQVKMMVRMQARMVEQYDSTARLGAVHRKAGAEFLIRNSTRKGVVVRSSGLQYEVLRPGTGRKPRAGDDVDVAYTGTLIDGTVFDSNTRHGLGPSRFNVDSVIAGWTEALMMMRVGSKWRIYVPSGIAYGGDPPPGGIIPPGAVLIFEIELLGVVRK